MSYIGIALALYVLYVGFKVGFQPRESDGLVYVTPFGPIYMGIIFGLSILVTTVGPFVLLGAKMPSTESMFLVVLLSIAVMVVYYWKLAIEIVDACHNLPYRVFANWRW